MVKYVQQNTVFAFTKTFHKGWCLPHEPIVFCTNVVKLHSEKCIRIFDNFFLSVFRGGGGKVKPIPSIASPVKNVLK